MDFFDGQLQHASICLGKWASEIFADDSDSMINPGYFSQYIAAINRSFAATQVTDRSGIACSIEEGIERASHLAEQVRMRKGMLFFCGNGASSAMSGHMALDWLKAGSLKALSFNDPSVLTAVANDTGYDNAFALPLNRLGSSGDMLVAISSSGNSPNVLLSVQAARDLGMMVVTFTGFRADNRSRQLGDLNFYVPCRSYGIAECCHQILLHAWLDHYLGIKEWE